MLSHIPVWVFAVLILLLAIGYRQSHPRDLAPRMVLLIAIAMSAYSLLGLVSTFGAAPAPIVGWAAGQGLAVTLGRRLLVPPGISFVPAARKVHVPGSWIPMLLVIGIFCVRFALGFAAGVGAPVQPESALATGLALMLGLLSGGFAARALAVQRVARSAGAAT